MDTTEQRDQFKRLKACIKRAESVSESFVDEVLNHSPFDSRSEFIQSTNKLKRLWMKEARTISFIADEMMGIKPTNQEQK